jgi:hypothetical protein
MQNRSLFKAGILTLVIVVLGITCWEVYLRTHGIGISYDDGKNYGLIKEPGCTNLQIRQLFSSALPGINMTWISPPGKP